MDDDNKEIKQSREVERNAFEEERKLLLDRMAVQLKGVIQQMDRVNHNIGNIDTKTVNDVAKLWKESYEMSARSRDSKEDKDDPSSLLNFQKGF